MLGVLYATGREGYELSYVGDIDGRLATCAGEHIQEGDGEGIDTIILRAQMSSELSAITVIHSLDSSTRYCAASWQRHWYESRRRSFGPNSYA